MPDLLAMLRDEIRKQARKEIRASLKKTKKLVASHRREIAELKRQLAQAQQQIAYLESCEAKRIEDARSKQSDESSPDLRFSSKSVRTHRTRIDLTASEYGLLLGVSAQTIYKWERGKARPGKTQLANLAELRRIGKKEARERLRLIQLEKSNPKRSR